MRIERIKNILFIVFLFVSLACALVFVSLLKQKYDLIISINQLEVQVKALEEENQSLLQMGQQDKKKAQQLLQQNLELKNGLRSLREKSESLIEEKYLLEEKKTEEQGLRVDSSAEIRKALKELKKQIRKLSVEIEDKTTEGNRGFLIKKEEEPQVPAENPAQNSSAPQQ